MKFAASSDAPQDKIAASIKSIRVEVVDGELQLVRPQLKLTRWAFNQICGLVGTPASYLAALPATLAAQNLNHALANLDLESLVRRQGWDSELGWRGTLTLYVYQDVLENIFTGARPDLAKEAL